MNHSPDSIRQQLAKGFFGFWVQNWRVSFLVIALIVFMGFLTLFTMPKESSPKINFGIIQVTTIYLGVNPVDMDTLVTEEIENAVEDIDGIKKLTSTSVQGIAYTTIELYNDVDTQKALVEIKDEIDKVRLPDEAEDPIVTELSTDSEVMFELLVYGDAELYPQERLKELARSIQKKLEGKHDITSIDIVGSAEYDLHVLLDKAKMEQIGLTIGQVGSSIRSFNQNQPLGSFEVDELKYDFRIQGEFSNIQELLDIPIVFQGYSQLKLGDIASIEKDYDDEAVRRAGIPGDVGNNTVTMIFNKKDGANIFTASKKAKQAISDLFQTQEFKGAGYLFSTDMSEAIIEDYRTLGISGAQTLIFVFLSLLIFVGFKEAGIATVAIPMAFLITFIVLDQLGLSLNFLTNFSLVLTLGIAIDTTIVIIEAAYENLKLGYNPKTAILLAVRDFKRPLIAGTSTTIVVFIPMMVLPGVTGKFLAYIPITVFSTLIAALFIALTINSALFFKLSKRKKSYLHSETIEKFLTTEDKALLVNERQGKEAKEEGHFSHRERILESLNRNYERILRSFISKKRNRWLSVLVPIGALIFTFVFLSPRIGFTLFPDGDNERFDMLIEEKVGTPTEKTAEHAPFIEEVLGAVPELKLYSITVNNNNMSVVVELTDKKLRARKGQRNVFDTEADVLEQLTPLQQKGLKVESLVLAGGPPQAKPVGIKLLASSNDLFGELIQVAKDFEAHLRTIEGTKNASLSTKDTPGQFVFSFDKTKLSSLGLTPTDVVLEISAALNGFPAGSIKIDNEDVDIKLLHDEFDNNVSPAQIQDLVVATKAGPLRIGEVLEYSVDNAVAEISREDTDVTVRVESDLADGFRTKGPTIQAEFVKFANDYSFPEGISFSASGEGQENADLIQATLRGLVIAFFLIFVILVLQFNSFSQPSIILYSVILALLGVNVGLFVTGNPYSMPFAIGFIALMGIVVNDAIIMIDRINTNIAHKIDIFESIIEASRSRLQPIILTTLTTLLGVLPISLQDEFWEGLGFTMIFGLFAGSAMTLFVIPSLYYMVFVKKKDVGDEKKSEGHS